MSWLREFLPSSSLDSMRVRNFERCAKDAPGIRVINQEATRTGQNLTIRLAMDASMNSDLIQMLNTSSVTITEISTKQEATHVEVRIT